MPGSALELEPGEQLLAIAPVSFRGAGATTTRATFALGSARMRHKAFDAWRESAESGGFRTTGPEMLLGATNQRILVCSKTFWLGRLSEIEGSVPLSRIADIAVVRHGLVVGCALAFTTGHIVEVEAMRARRLRRWARAVQDAKAGLVS